MQYKTTFLEKEEIDWTAQILAHFLEVDYNAPFLAIYEHYGSFASTNS